MYVKQETLDIQTHNAVVVAATNGTAENADWIDCRNFRTLSSTMKNSAAASNKVDVLWSNDGSNQHSSDALMTTLSSAERSGTIVIRAPYFKIKLYNLDGSERTMSAWVYLS